MTTTTPLSLRDQSIINVLTRGSSIAPLSLGEIRKHLQETNKSGWKIILQEFRGKSPEYLQNIWIGVDSVVGVQFTSQQLIHMLLELEGSEEIFISKE